MDPREPTILFWLEKYKDICTFTKLRRKYSLEPESVINSKKLYHTQVYNLKYHDLKLNLAAGKFPELRQYVKETFDHCPHNLFRAESPRCSSIKVNIKPKRTTKYNNAPKLAEFALLLARTNKERHERVQEFMLINDTATIATELPIYLYPDELSRSQNKSLGLDFKDTLTGHIDILQVRFNKIHVLDYKPEASKTDKRAAEQVYLYALALSKRTNIPLENFVSAYFDERNYYQFKPELTRH